MRKSCSRCGKWWCGTNKRLKQLHPGEHFSKQERTYGSKKCRDRAAKMRAAKAVTS